MLEAEVGIRSHEVSFAEGAVIRLQLSGGSFNY
jgi:hypothetical protein